jgi:hypothetical protein
MVGEAHPVLLRGLTFDTSSGGPRLSTEGRPALVERTDEDFLEALLTELRTPEGCKRLARTVRNAGAPDRGLKLFQPVHRTFTLVLVDAACKTFGEPRLDAAKIESAGLVVRRMGARADEVEGWMHVNGEVRGWVPLRGVKDRDRDPDPERRGDPYRAGHPHINTHLVRALGAPEPYQESVTRLYPAPPEVCAALGRTVLYGLVPLASSELVSQQEAPRYGEDEIRALLSPWLTAGGPVPSLEGIANKRFTRKYVEEVGNNAGALQRLEAFATFLRGLVSVFDAFEDKALVAALDQVQLEYEGQAKKQPAGQMLKQAVDVFVHEKTGASVLLPKAWPRLTEAQATGIARAAGAASARRLQGLLPRRGRYDEAGARYHVRAFVRVRRDDGCPPKLEWSDPSQPFEIASWYENGRLPPIQVSLPPVTRDNVRNFKPNVAFQVPKNIFNLLAKNKPKDFLEGKAEDGGSGGLDWLCGFNIPIITLCAFIVLSIFLALLNIVFWWLAFIKICIPLPRSLTSGRAQGGAP